MSTFIPIAAQSWREQALCDGEETDLWFPPGTGDADPYAKALCEVCPVRRDCLEYALATRQSGFWAISEDDRAKDRKRRQRRGAAERAVA